VGVEPFCVILKVSVWPWVKTKLLELVMSGASSVGPIQPEIRHANKNIPLNAKIKSLVAMREKNALDV
jgi:hypothetical protein